MGGYTYAELRGKYGGFASPAFSVLVDGKALPEDVFISVMDVELTTLREESGTARFDVANKDSPYSDEKTAGLLSVFPLMSEIKIEMGYGRDITAVFEGVVFERELSAEGLSNGGLTVSCVDKKALLRLNNAYVSHAPVKSYAVLAEDIASKYRLNAVTGEAPKFGKPIPFNQNGLSDFSFIAGIAEEIGFEFYVLLKDFYFRKPGAVKDILLTFDKEGLYRFTHRTSMAGICSEAVVFAYNQDKNEEKVYTAKSPDEKTGNGFTGAEILQEHKLKLSMRESAYVNNRTERDLTALAQARMRENGELLAELTLYTDGLPELVPGRFIKLANILEGVNNTYYVIKAKHLFDKNGYRTELVCRSGATEG